MLIEPNHPALTVSRQCELLVMPRSCWYYRGSQDPGRQSRNEDLMKRIDRLFTAHPHLGVRSMTALLAREGEAVNVKRVRRLMRTMGLEPIYPKPRLSDPHPGHRIYPYLLRGVEVTRPDQVWATDITYIPLATGWAYLAAVLDWHSRYVLSWELSSTLETSFCTRAVEQALSLGVPEIFNSDQGSQFTSEAFTSLLSSLGVRISMDGRGRALDNVFVERLWRSVKYEDVYLRDYQTPVDAREGLSRYFEWYNHERPHQSLDNRTPAEVYGLGSRVPGGATRAAGTTVALRAPSVPAAHALEASPP